MFGVIKPQIQTTTNGASAASKATVILPFPKDNPTADESPDLSKWQSLAVKSGAAMTTPKNDTTIKLNPTVAALLVSLFGVLAVLAGFVYNYAALSTQFEMEKLHRQKLEIRLDKIEEIQRSESLNKAKIDGYQIGKAEENKEKEDKKK